MTSSDSMLTHLIDSIRSGMRALDASLALLEAHIAEQQQAMEAPEDPGPICPKCSAPIDLQAQDISTMGNPNQYACVHCDFRGKL